MPNVLFLCTGNYYRSRYAEIVFNSLAAAQGSDWRADSRGLFVTGLNPGPLAKDTIAALAKLNIPLPQPHRFPRPLAEQDLQRAQHIVAVKEAEHRALLASSFPDWVGRVEFWHVHDLDCAGPDEALPGLHQQVVDLLARLTAC
ncbi:MAG TPA: low molecular weight phosphatase family protein [Pirellulales bacterium]|jgi:protein-tyrosine phosphatase|nr:low molecular weight phosphatase family protein [Pirellulales bacterium]